MIRVSAGAPWPFGVVRAQSRVRDEMITLWSDADEESEHVGTEGTHVGDVGDIGIVEELDIETRVHVNSTEGTVTREA